MKEGNSNEAVGSRLGAFRICRDLSKKAFAESLGIASTQWTVIENGHRRLPINVAFKIREKYHLDLEFMYFGTTNLISPVTLKAIQEASAQNDPYSQFRPHSLDKRAP